MVIFSASSVVAQEWQKLPGMTTAKLAASGFQQVSAAGLSWPDGRQAVVTFWTTTFDQKNFTMRCISFYNESFQQTGDICSQAVGKDQ